MSQVDYLNAMGISTWVVKDEEVTASRDRQTLADSSQTELKPEVSSSDSIVWTFVVDDLSEIGSLLFDKILASLMLTRTTIQLVNSSRVQSESIKGQVIVAMGSGLGKSLLGLQEPFNELRGAVHSFDQGGDEIPVVLTYHPNDLLKNPLDKIKTWQDLILARSLI
ncbi:MAG: DNA polymerase III subunit psi [Polynucleobacter sp.]|jgi:DNA polymerase III psi subunit